MKKFLMSSLIILTCSIPNAAMALKINETVIADSVTQTPGTPALKLNGAGIRTKFFMDIYIGALYLTQPASQAKSVLNDPGPKRVLMHFLYKEVSREKLVDGWNDGFRANTPDAGFLKLKDRIDKFNAMMQTVKAGEEIVIDFLADKTTVVTIKGEKKGTIIGSDFQSALLNIWLGNEPVTEKLKKAMLGKL